MFWKCQVCFSFHEQSPSSSLTGKSTSSFPVSFVKYATPLMFDSTQNMGSGELRHCRFTTVIESSVQGASEKCDDVMAQDRDFCGEK